MRLDSHIHRKQRPGYPKRRVSEERVGDWIDTASSEGIEKLVVLLSEGELDDYYDSLLNRYTSEFGDDSLLHVPIRDHTRCDPETLHEEILPFLRESVEADEEVAVHCSAGIGRTGQVLFAWMVEEHGMSYGEAMSAVRGVECNPLEALNSKELKALVTY